MSFFSIIIPTYNNAVQLPQAVKSIIAQTFEDWELIVVDDGSMDNTNEVILPLLEDNRIRYIKQKNQGVTSARNKGALHARGNFLAFLDSDDEVTSNWLMDFKYLLDITPAAAYLSCGYFRNEERKYPKLDKNISPCKYSSLAGTFALKKEIFQKIGTYDPVLKQSENWEMTARAIEYCLENNWDIVHTDNANFIYHHNPTFEEIIVRDEHRANAALHLHNKYKKSGVLHFRKDEFLVSSAVNYSRAGKIGKSRRIFYKILKEKPSIENLKRIIIFEIPFLRRKRWMRVKK